MREHIKVWVQDKGGGFLRMQWVDWLGDRKTQSTGTKKRARAEAMAAKLQERLNAGGSAANHEMTWEEFRELFLEEYAAGKRKKTREKYECVFDVFLTISRVKRLIDVTERTLSKFVKGMRERGSAPQTQKSYLVALKTALKWAADQKLLQFCPKFPKVQVPKKRPQPVPQEDFDKLLAEAPSDLWRAYLLCGWYEGLRLNEALELRKSKNDKLPWLDLAAKRVWLPAEFCKKGEDDWLPLHPAVEEAMAKLPPCDDDRVFPFRSRKGGDYTTPNGISNRIILMARRAGVKLSMHRLRKGFGCRVAKQLGKGNAPMLHRLMRHSSMQVTMDYYASVDDALEDVMKELK